MALILGIETSCDETGTAIFDTSERVLRSHAVFSQVDLHKKYGGVIPEIASRSQLAKIDTVVDKAFSQAGLQYSEIDAVAVTNRPGLVGSLLVGICFAKSFAWSLKKKLIGVNHLEGHIFSSFLRNDFSVDDSIPFPHLALTASGGHTALYYVYDFGKYECLANTLDDAAGEAFDKIAKLLGFGYPGGAVIEQQAKQAEFQDFFCYPRTKNPNKKIRFSFSGLKTAVLYHFVKEGYYDLNSGKLLGTMPDEFKQRVASSLLVCIADIFKNNIRLAFNQYPNIKALTFGGGVACNKYISQELRLLCQKYNRSYYAPPLQFCTDNGGMIAFVGGYKYDKGEFSDLTLDVNS